MIKLKQQPSFIEENSNNNFQSFIDKKFLEINNITENQNFVINNAYDFYNQIEQSGQFSKKVDIRNNIYIISFFIIWIVFSVLLFNYFGLTLDIPSIIVSIIFVVTIVGMVGVPLFFLLNYIFYTNYLEDKIKAFNNLFDNKYEPISPAQIYYTQNKEISDNDLNKHNFWKPMNTEELFNWIEKNNL